MYDTRDLASLLAVITEGSFDAAAKSLHVTPGAMSQRIKHLEDKVGQLLVIRTQPARATPAGEILLRLAQQISLLSDETAQLLQPQHQNEPRLLTIAVNHDSLATWFRQVVDRLTRQSNLLLDIRCGDASQTGKLLRDGTAVAAVLSAPEPIPGCSIHRLGTLRYDAVATPAFVKRWLADGLTVDSLAQAPIILFDRGDHLTAQFIRRLIRKSVTPPVHYIPSSHDIAAAVRSGLGWSMLPAGLSKADLASGMLVRLTRNQSLDLPLHWQVWSVEAALIQHVTSAVTAAAKRELTAAR
jgi:LysR family transcriptional regulator (chromosome initiation inhibitor)